MTVGAGVMVTGVVVPHAVRASSPASRRLLAFTGASGHAGQAVEADGADQGDGLPLADGRDRGGRGEGAAVWGAGAGRVVLAFTVDSCRTRPLWGGYCE
ncbi:hypothetical protein DEGR_22350 [Deinococcus grandis]|nr:hypothetical protein DEGR_22350 [Deinococcus grandis]